MIINDLSPAAESKDLNVQLQLERERMAFERERMTFEREREERVREEKALELEREEKRMAFEREQKELDRELEREKLKFSATQASYTTYNRRSASSLMPEFKERNVELFFEQFEKTAHVNKWPVDDWVNLIQSKLSGKAVEIYSSLPIEDLTDYTLVKQKVLDAYFVTSEKLRQIFRASNKYSDETYLDFANRFVRMFDKWLSSEKTEDFEGLRNLILTEHLFSVMNNEIKTYFVDKKCDNVIEVAKLADSYDLSLKQVKKSKPFTDFKPKDNSYQSKNNPKFYNKNKNNYANNFKSSSNSNYNVNPNVKPPAKFCTYCNKPNHTIDYCWKRQSDYRLTEGVSQNVQASQPMNASESYTAPVSSQPENAKPALNVSNLLKCNHKLNYFKNFVHDGYCSSFDNSDLTCPIISLRDTGSSATLLVKNSVPSKFLQPLDAYTLIDGVGSQYVPVPLYKIKLHSAFGFFEAIVGLVDKLPIDDVNVILGNDLLGDRVQPDLDILKYVSDNVDCMSNKNNPVILNAPIEDTNINDNLIFPDCVVTRSQVKPSSDNNSDKAWNLDSSEFNLSDTFMYNLSEDPLDYSKNTLISAQEADLSLNIVRCKALSFEDSRNENNCYYERNNVLMRKWMPINLASSENWSVKTQIVLPTKYRNSVLRRAHDSPLGGHLGIAKTMDRICNYFYWPGLRKDVTHYCRTCQTCQKIGKPNLVIPPAPLNPIPVLDPPFSRILIDVVGPLPRTSSGNRYLFTLMDLSTRYPEAFPIKEISADTIADHLIKYFSNFGICKEIQSDQGSNFMSNLISDLCKRLNVNHIVASAYHPQTQGALERYHQTLKTMMRAYCEENSNDWDKGIPLLLFASREVPVESLGFSPFELVYGHKVRGPLYIMHESFLSEEKTSDNVVNYVFEFQNRLIETFDLAQINLRNAQSKMKTWYDKKSRERNFKVGDKVLALLPIFGQPLKSKFCGPYDIIKKLNDVNYVLATPDRRKDSRVCHINMLKLFHERNPVCFLFNPEISVPDFSDDNIELEFRQNNSEFINKLDSQLQHLDINCRNQIKSLISTYNDVFSDFPGLTNQIFHDIDVGDAAPIKQAPYRVNPKKANLMSNEIDKMLKSDIIEPSTSSWSSPVILIPKEVGSVRTVVDLRKVNSVSKGDSFPLPRIDDIIDKIGHAKFLSKFDARKGYFQVPLTDRAKPITAFVTSQGLFQFKRMPYGVKGGPATFQRLMNKLLGRYSFIVVYIDDICVFSNTWEDHLLHIKILFDIMRDSNLTLNLEKSVFANAEIVFLGFKIGRGTLLPKDRNVEAIQQLKTPVCKRDIQRILGVIGYFRRFVPNFSILSAPLTNLLQKNVKFVWNVECEESFKKLKAIICNPPILRLPNFNKPFKLAVDASSIGIGAVLLQEDDNSIEHPISYYSKKLSKCQCNYSTIEKEAFALISAIKHFSVYLEYGKVIVYTDHNPLVFIHRYKNNNSKLLRWALILQPYDLDIVHIAGRKNVLADFLSRLILPDN